MIKWIYIYINYVHNIWFPSPADVYTLIHSANNKLSWVVGHIPWECQMLYGVSTVISIYISFGYVYIICFWLLHYFMYRDLLSERWFYVRFVRRSTEIFLTCLCSFLHNERWNLIWLWFLSFECFWVNYRVKY